MHVGGLFEKVKKDEFGFVTAVGCYTLRGRCVCVFGVKCGDLCGSEAVVAQGADWHSDAGRKWS